MKCPSKNGNHSSFKVDIFIPSNLLTCSSHSIIGTYKREDNYYQVNCMLGYHADSTSYEKLFHDVEVLKLSLRNDFDKNYEVKVLGLMCHYEPQKLMPLIQSYLSGPIQSELCFIFLVHENKIIDITHLWIKSQEVNSKSIARVIIYDGLEILSSQLLLDSTDVFETADKKDKFCNETFLPLLVNSSQLCLKFKLNNQNLDSIVYPFETTNSHHSLKEILSSLFIRIVILFSSIYISAHSYFSTRIPSIIRKAIMLTSIGKQLTRRLCHLAYISNSLQQRDFSLRFQNLCSSIVIDAICGIVITYLMMQFVKPQVLLENAMVHTNQVVNELQKLLNWLMGVPAGLKLNYPLNTALGHFFLYHIYLWKTYMAIIKPAFAYVMESFIIFGVLGATFLLSLLNDLISLATIHIYCFYGYATRLYGLQISGLTSLWRLFRGKKWNPLRQRVDSYTYDVHQLFIGTLMFTVLLFLLPTVLLYYLVFTLLHLIVLSIQGIISRTVFLLSLLPVGVLFLRFIDSPSTAGNVNFSVIHQQEATVLMLAMQIVHIPLQNLIRQTLFEDKYHKQYKECAMSWKNFFNYLIWGKIIQTDIL